MEAKEGYQLRGEIRGQARTVPREGTDTQGMGMWNEELLPVRWETVEVSLSDAYKIRRIYRKLAKMRGRGHLQRLTVFIRYENVVRLLEFLGYLQEE